MSPKPVNAPSSARPSWKELIQAQPKATTSTPVATAFPNSVSSPFDVSWFRADGTSAPSDSAEPGKVQSPYAVRVFAADERRDLLTMRVHPRGENAEADAVLALVYGYSELRDVDDVPVTKLLTSARLSGFRVERIDRAAAPYIRSNLLLKTGSAKGSKYTLTTTGRARAEALVKELHDTVA